MKFQINKPKIELILFILINIPNTSFSKTVADKKGRKAIIELADPTIICVDKKYYLYGTGGSKGNVDSGFEVYTSSDMKIWRGPVGVRSGYALAKGDVIGTSGFWAPHVFSYNSKLYMAFTANEQIAIAKSDSPYGPFRQDTMRFISGVNKQIDPYVFLDEDGKIYLYHVRLDKGNKIYVAEMKHDLSDIKPETSHFCLDATETWENTDKTSWSVTEGPTVIKHNNLYYLFYSANDFRSKDYAVGYATSNSPNGPWVKSNDNPIISRNLIKQNGPGHGDLFKDKNGKWKYVFHLHASFTTVNPRKTAIINSEFVKDRTGKEKIKMNKKSVSEITVNK